MPFTEDVLRDIFKYIEPYEAGNLPRVCTSWFSVAQEHLYSCLELDSDRSFRSLHRTLCSRPSLAERTKTLIFPLIRVNMSKLRPADIRAAYVSRARIDKDGYLIPALFKSIPLDNIHFHELMLMFYQILIHCKNLQELHAPLSMVWIHTDLPSFARLRRLVLICPNYNFKRSPLFNEAIKFHNLESLYLVHGNNRVASQVMKLRVPALKNLYIDGFFGILSLAKLVEKFSSPDLFFYCNAIVGDEVEKPHQPNTTVYHPGSLRKYCGSLAYNMKFHDPTPSGFFDDSPVSHLILISSENRGNGRLGIMTPGLRSLNNLDLDKLPKQISKLTLIAHDWTGQTLSQIYVQELIEMLPTLSGNHPNIKSLYLSIKATCPDDNERLRVIELYRTKSINLSISFTYAHIPNPLVLQKSSKQFQRIPTLY